jgi:hypothetical protein
MNKIAPDMRQTTSQVFTVGHEESYDQGLLTHGRKFMKQGLRGDYPGGFAVKSIRDAQRLITEMNKRGVWAIYSLEADWEKDTVPSLHGWWHALVHTRRIVEKVGR